MAVPRASVTCSVKRTTSPCRACTRSGVSCTVTPLLATLGRSVARLHDGPLAAGPHTFALDAGRLPAGVYIVRAVTPGGNVARRLTLLD